MRDEFEDVNQDKAFGGRLRANLFSGQNIGSTIFDISFYTGAVNPSASQRLSIVDLALTLKLTPFLLRAEAAQSFLNLEGDSMQTFERGVYSQISFKQNKWDLSGRWDYAATFKDAILVSEHWVVFAALYQIVPSFAVRGEISIPIANSNDENLSHKPAVGGMLSFSI